MYNRILGVIGWKTGVSWKRRWHSSDIPIYHRTIGMYNRMLGVIGWKTGVSWKRRWHSSTKLSPSLARLSAAYPSNPCCGDKPAATVACPSSDASTPISDS